MGTRGPIPKRTELRMGHPREAQSPSDVARVEIHGSVQVPELGFEPSHDIVAEIWEAVKVSGQSIFYEPSDWAMLKFWLMELNDYMDMVKKSPSRLDVIASNLSGFLLTEGDRRRMKMEIDRSGSAEEEEQAHQQRMSNVLQLAKGSS